MKATEYTFIINDDFYNRDIIPEGVLFINTDVQIFGLKCPCGCGEDIIGRMKGPHPFWTVEGNTLKPSINCINLPCKSHFNITNGKVSWS